MTGGLSINGHSRFARHLLSFGCAVINRLLRCARHLLSFAFGVICASRVIYGHFALRASFGFAVINGHYYTTELQLNYN
jgi:hypothetical protein